MIHNAPLTKRFSLIGDIVKTVDVDIDSTAWNPDGSNTNKFATIGEATQLLNLPEIAGLVVRLANNKTYPYTNIYSEKVVTITPADTDTIDTIVNGISVEDSNMCYVTSVIVTGIGTHNFDFRLRRSTVEITSCKVGGNHTYHIIAWHSKVRFYNVTNATGVTGALFYITAENELTCLDTTPTYNVLNKMPAINKPVKLVSCTALTNTEQNFNVPNMDLLSLSEQMYVEGSGLYYQFGSYILTQKTDGGNRNISFVFDNVLCKYRIVFDYTNSRVKVRLTKAVNLETGADVTSSTTGTSLILFVSK